MTAVLQPSLRKHSSIIPTIHKRLMRRVASTRARQLGAFQSLLGSVSFSNCAMLYGCLSYCEGWSEFSSYDPAGSQRALATRGRRRSSLLQDERIDKTRLLQEELCARGLDSFDPSLLFATPSAIFGEVLYIRTP